MKKLISAIWLLLIPSLLLARGGSLVGNGAGLVESRFQYAYITLHKVLLNCVANADCDLKAEELKLAGKIADVMTLNMNNPKKFVFMTEEEISKIMTTGVYEPHRIAMTGLTADIPIYVNVDQLYDSSGRPQLDYATIIGLIFHEVGHQSGEPSHATLDHVGSLIRLRADSETLNYTHDMADPDRLKISVSNFSLPNKFAEIRITADGKLLNLSPIVMRQLKCRATGAQLSGYEFFNGFFSPEVKRTNPTFNFTANLYCLTPKSSRPILERVGVKFDVEADHKISNWDLKRSL